MRFVNVHEAKTQLSRLIKAVEAGEEVVIQRDGKPVVKLVLVEDVAEPRKPGAWAGQVVLAPDFDAPLSEAELAEFYGE